MVEQRIENPRVGGSIPPLGTIRQILLAFIAIRNSIFHSGIAGVTTIILRREEGAECSASLLRENYNVTLGKS